MENRRLFFHGVQYLKSFFLKEGFLEVYSPPIVSCPGIEPHLDALKVSGKHFSGLLHTSPEFAMKALLVDFEKIFSLNFSFRDEPSSARHRPQFLMLEWYRKGASYQAISEDVRALIKFLHSALAEELSSEHENIRFEESSVNQLFKEYCAIDLDAASSSRELLALALNSPVAKYFEHSADFNNLPYEDIFFLIFLNEIEPRLRNGKITFIKDYPPQLAALSEIETIGGKARAKRFEVYWDGVEIGNCFQELCDPQEQKWRAKEWRAQRARAGKEIYPPPKVLIDAITKLDAAAGIAIGVERLIAQCLKHLGRDGATFHFDNLF